MTGIILAGGTGSRLKPLTSVANKHLLPVYDKPMIYYPIETLKGMGCSEIVIISGGENLGGFAELLGDGSDFGVRFTYRVQNRSDGVAGALLCAEGLVSGTFPVILGDNYLSEAPTCGNPGIFLKAVPDAHRFGVYENGIIVEKPENPSSDRAVIGMYAYSGEVFDYIRSLKPSKRGELEITDVNNWYLSNKCAVNDYSGYWSDMGTFDSLLRTANYIKENKR